MAVRSKNIVRVKFPKVYEYNHPKSGTYFLVDARSKKWGMNERPTFPTKKLALKHAEDIEGKIRQSGAQTDVPKEKVILADRFQDLTVQLAHFGKTPEDAVQHYVQHLGKEAARQSLPFIRELVDGWTKYKRADKTVTERYLKEAEMYGRFIKRKWGDKKPDEIKRNDVDLTLKGMKISNNTRRKFLRFIRMFFNWVVEEGHIPKNPTVGIKFKSDDFEAKFYTPEQIKKLLRYVAETNKDLVGYFALLTFAGLRPSEGTRVQWEDYSPKVKELYVRKGKTGHRHIILQPAAVEWLQWHKDNNPKDAPFIKVPNLENRMKKIREAVFNGGWIQDGLRHGFGTYYKSKIKSINEVADYMGNSPGIVKRHYASTIPADECQTFWDLTPAVVLADEPTDKKNTATSSPDDGMKKLPIAELNQPTIIAPATHGKISVGCSGG
jgi:integrase